MWRRFHEPFWHPSAAWLAGRVRKHPKQRLNRETYYFFLHFKDQAVFVPTLSCRHVIMDVCLSPASDMELPDMEPTAMLQQARKP